jgi:hypothetical protein
VPVRGELVPGPDSFEIEVLDADPRRVKRVRIYKVNGQRDKSRDTPRDPRRRIEQDNAPVTAPTGTTKT